MVDVSTKADTMREATAQGRILMRPETLALVERGAMEKGDVLAVAQIGGVMAAKQTGTLIPLCHPLPITGVDLRFSFDREASAIEIEATARVVGKTGVEMEALAAVSVAALTIYDMCKAVDRAMVISDIRLAHKAGGQSGEFLRKDYSSAQSASTREEEARR
jgi:cyclic pyranopterin phosphate synthase